MVVLLVPLVLAVNPLTRFSFFEGKTTAITTTQTAIFPKLLEA